jgi:hypothetical protein
MTNLPIVLISHLELADRFAAVTQSLISVTDRQGAFVALARLGVDSVDGAQHASITVLRRGQFDTRAATSDLPEQVDAIQYELKTGPCVDAVLDDSIYRTGDLGADPRWPEFGRRAAAATGVHSMLAFRLFSEDDSVLAALNLYSVQRDAFDDNAVLVGGVLATHGALALSSAGKQERITNLEEALQSNREIGVAIGVLMRSHLLTQQQSFDLLRMASQRSHRKLRDLAASVVETGGLDLS